MLSLMNLRQYFGEQKAWKVTGLLIHYGREIPGFGTLKIKEKSVNSAKRNYSRQS